MHVILTSYMYVDVNISLLLPLFVQPPAIPQMIGGGNMTLGSPVIPGGASPSSASQAGAMDPLLTLGCPNSVLRVIIENMLYPITIDVLHRVCCCKSWACPLRYMHVLV